MALSIPPPNKNPGYAPAPPPPVYATDAMVLLTEMKQPRATAEKVTKPLTLAEMRAEILVLKPQSPRKANQAATSVKGNNWNSSVKVEKKISHTADGQLKNHAVRKVLNIPAKTSIPIPKNVIKNTKVPKFPRPEFRAKKSLYSLQAKNSVRIRIPPTPVETKPAIPSNRANKENVPNQKSQWWLCANFMKNELAPTAPKLKNIPTSKAETPLSNSSWESGCDASFLQKEKEILEVEEKVKAVAEEQTLENIAEVSAPVSTPFKEYSGIQEYFNNSSCSENSALFNDNTIMCFVKTLICTDNDKKEESLIVSLCDLFNKATDTITEKKLNNLLEVKKRNEKNIRMLENSMKMLANIRESQIKYLQNVKKLIEEKKNARNVSESDKDNTLEAEIKDVNKTLSPEKSPILSKPCTIIKSPRLPSKIPKKNACLRKKSIRKTMTLVAETKDVNKTLSPVKSSIHSKPCLMIKSPRLPSYKIPKNNACLRKKSFCKSIPNVSSVEMHTPVKDLEGRALNMYMKLKENINFLRTPMVNCDKRVPDTPALTSLNLQEQLDKLFGS